MLILLMLVLTIAIQSQNAYAQGSNNDANSKKSDDSNSNSNANLRIDISTIPSKLVKGSEGFLVVQIYNNNEPAPFVASGINITSSNPEVLSIDKDSIEQIGNSLLIKAIPLSSGSATITLTTKDLNLKPVSKKIDVYEPLDKPSKLALTVKPSSFNYLGPFDGYIAVQLLNAVDEPVIADKDYDIEVRSSNTSILDVNTSIRISKGENFAYMHFNVNPNGNGSVTVTARHGYMVASANITIEGTEGRVLRLYTVDIVPAVKGHPTYAFVQLQDSKGRVLYADKDINVEVRADTKDIIGGTGVIRRGESTAVVRLIVNTDKPLNIDKECNKSDNSSDTKPCINLIAVAVGEGMVSEAVKIDIREPIIEDYTSYQKSKSIGSDYLKIYAQLSPNNMPIIADGKSKAIGVIQLISYSDNNKFARPVIANTDTIIDLVSSNKLTMTDTKVTIPKGRSMELVTAHIGYNASSIKVNVLADYLENSALELSIQGHKDVSISVEPLLSIVPYSMQFPYLIYFKDSEGRASYATDDINVRINADGISIRQGSNSLRKGDSITLMELEAIRKGNISIYLEAIGPNSRYESHNSIDVISSDNSNIELDMYVPDTIIVGSKYLASVQLLYKGYPFSADKDTRIIVFSNSNSISIPTNVSIAKERYFTFFTVEANHKGKVDITLLADGINSISKEINVVEDKLMLKLDSKDSVNKMDIFDVTLTASYANMPLSNLRVKWGSDLAVLTSMYDDITDTNGIARAKFLAYDKGVITVSATIYGYGIERSISIKVKSTEVDVSSNDDNARNNNDNNSSSNSNVNNASKEDISLEDSIFDKLAELPIDAEYLIMLPTLAGLITWFINKKRSKSK